MDALLNQVLSSQRIDEVLPLLGRLLGADGGTKRAHAARYLQAVEKLLSLEESLSVERWMREQVVADLAELIPDDGEYGILSLLGARLAQAVFSEEEIRSDRCLRPLVGKAVRLPSIAPVALSVAEWGLSFARYEVLIRALVDSPRDEKMVALRSYALLLSQALEAFVASYPPASVVAELQCFLRQEVASLRADASGDALAERELDCLAADLDEL